VRDLLGQLGLDCWAKTSGNKGLQVYAPLNSGASYEGTTPFAKAVAQLLERRHSDLILSYQLRAARTGKVLIDWSQNVASKTTVSVYSLRARAEPTVSTPVAWDELDEARSSGDAGKLTFDWRQVLQRVEHRGDLMAEVLGRKQDLPELRA
jgi:bifunctional non-homologous end joining protein LigD